MGNVGRCVGHSPLSVPSMGRHFIVHTEHNSCSGYGTLKSHRGRLHSGWIALLNMISPSRILLERDPVMLMLFQGFHVNNVGGCHQPLPLVSMHVLGDIAGPLQRERVCI